MWTALFARPERARGIAATILVLGAAGALAGCGTLPNGRRWGDDVTLWPSGARLGRAAWNALSHPMTWAPIAGAAVLQIDRWDERISDWATDTTPLFGSVEKAEDARGWTGNASDLLYFASVIATPSGDEPLDWAWAKTKGLAVGMGARVATLTSVDLLKVAVGRERPDGSNDKSFPSQHAAAMSVNATLTSQNLRSMSLPVGARYSLDAGSIGLAAFGSWSRVEADGHYPSDVLAGVALGHFLARFFEEAFLGLAEGPLQVEPVAMPDLFGLAFSWRF